MWTLSIPGTPLSLISSPSVIGMMTVNEILATGARLGFTGGGDCHEGHIGLTTEIPDGQGQVPHGLSQNHLHRSGLTGALLPELTRSALINALRSRMTYATTGARILLDFAVDRSGQGNRVTCRAVVHAVNTLHCVEIIKNGSTLFRKDIEAVDVEFEWTDSTDPDMVAYYYLRAEQKDGHMAWSSPVWIDQSCDHSGPEPYWA